MKRGKMRRENRLCTLCSGLLKRLERVCVRHHSRLSPSPPPRDGRSRRHGHDNGIMGVFNGLELFLRGGLAAIGNYDMKQ